MGAAQQYLASADAEQLRLTDLPVLLTDFKRQAHPVDAQSITYAGVFVSPAAALSAGVAGIELQSASSTGASAAASKFSHIDAGSLRLGDVLELQTAYMLNLKRAVAVAAQVEECKWAS